MVVFFCPKLQQLIFSKFENLKLEDLRIAFHKYLMKKEESKPDDSSLISMFKFKESRVSQMIKKDMDIYPSCFLNNKRFSVLSKPRNENFLGSNLIGSNYQKSKLLSKDLLVSQATQSKKSINNTSIVRPQSVKRRRALKNGFEKQFIIIYQNKKTRNLNYMEVFRMFLDKQNMRNWDNVIRIHMQVYSKKQKDVRVFFDKNDIDKEMFVRAKRYIEVLFGEIPAISLDFICTQDERKFEESLYNLSPKFFCEYLTYKIHIYIHKNRGEELTQFETEWSVKEFQTGPSSIFLSSIRLFQVINMTPNKLFSTFSVQSKVKTDEELKGVANFIMDYSLKKLRVYCVYHLKRVAALSDNYGLDIRNFLQSIFLIKKHSKSNGFDKGQFKLSKELETLTKSGNIFETILSGKSEKIRAKLIDLIYMPHQKKLLEILHNNKFNYNKCYLKTDFILSQNLTFFKEFIQRFKQNVSFKKPLNQRLGAKPFDKSMSVQRKMSKLQRKHCATSMSSKRQMRFKDIRKNSFKTLVTFFGNEKERVESNKNLPEEYFDQMKELMKKGLLNHHDKEDAKLNQKKKKKKRKVIKITKKPMIHKSEMVGKKSKEKPVNLIKSNQLMEAKKRLTRQPLKSGINLSTKPFNFFFIKYFLKTKKSKQRKKLEESKKVKEKKHEHKNDLIRIKPALKKKTTTSHTYNEEFYDKVVLKAKKKMEARRLSISSAFNDAYITDSIMSKHTRNSVFHRKRNTNFKSDRKYNKMLTTSQKKKHIQRNSLRLTLNNKLRPFQATTYSSNYSGIQKKGFFMNKKKKELKAGNYDFDNVSFSLVHSPNSRQTKNTKFFDISHLKNRIEKVKQIKDKESLYSEDYNIHNSFESDGIKK